MKAEGQIEAIHAGLARLQSQLEQGGDLRGAVAAVKTKLEALETAAKLTGQIQTGSRSLTLVANNTVIDEGTAVKMARVYLERHSAGEGECTTTS
jgi:hypothetical protein